MIMISTDIANQIFWFLLIIHPNILTQNHLKHTSTLPVESVCVCTRVRVQQVSVKWSRVKLLYRLWMNLIKSYLAFWNEWMKSGSGSNFFFQDPVIW